MCGWHVLNLSTMHIEAWDVGRSARASRYDVSLFYVKSVSLKEQMSRYFHRIIHARAYIKFRKSVIITDWIIDSSLTLLNSARITPQPLVLSNPGRILYGNSCTKAIKFILCDSNLYGIVRRCRRCRAAPLWRMLFTYDKFAPNWSNIEQLGRRKISIMVLRFFQ